MSASWWDKMTYQNILNISYLNLGIDDETFDKICSLVDFKHGWTPQGVQDTYKGDVIEHEGCNK